MQEEKVITGASVEDIFGQLSQHLKQNQDALETRVIIEHNHKRILLEIDIDLGGGFESGFSSTEFGTPVRINNDFRFSVHHQGFIDDIGKFFGMQDVEIGYPDFDKKLIIKSTNEAKVKALFADESVRTTLQLLPDFTFGIMSHHITNTEKGPFLEMYIDTAINDVSELEKIFIAYTKVLDQLEAT